MHESHVSLRDDYQVSTKELDALVDIAMAVDGLQAGQLQQVVVADLEPMKALLRDKSLQSRQVDMQPAQVHVDRQFPERGLTDPHRVAIGLQLGDEDTLS